jgi:hypothetical protein
MIPEPGDEQVTEVRVARWDKLQPAGGPWNNLVGESAARDEVIGQLRELADFLQSRPEIPVPLATLCASFSVFAAGTDQEKFAQVDYVSTLLGTPVADDLASGGHYTTSVSFGDLEYEFIAVAREPVEREPVSFTAGQEVQIIPESAWAFQRAGISRAGVVVSAEPDSQYLVRVPGQMNVSMPGAMLQPAKPIAVETSSGMVAGLSEIEIRLVDVLARTRVSQSRDQAPDQRDVADTRALKSALLRICGLPSGTLLRQLEPMVSARAEAYQLADDSGRKAARPARRNDQARSSSRNRR